MGRNAWGLPSWAQPAIITFPSYLCRHLLSSKYVPTSESGLNLQTLFFSHPRKH